MAAYTLVIGNKNLSSWSLRPWLALKAAGAPFEEVTVRLDQPYTRASIKTISPGGKVPLLKISENGKTHFVWESIAICETIAERHPEAKLWPDDPYVRAKARAYAAEMHAGFADMRGTIGMQFARKLPMPELSDAVQSQIARIIGCWSEALSENPAGGFLFGRFSIADCMYAPVVSRFNTYGIELPPPVKAYADRMMNHPAMQEWMAGAKAEIERGWK